MLVACPMGGVLAAIVFPAPTANPDSLSFLAIARNLLEGRGFTYAEPMMPGLELKAFRSPAYAAFLAASIATLGTGFTLLIQGMLAGATAALVADIARRIRGPRAAWITLAGMLGWVQAWHFSGQLMTETVYTFLLCIAMWWMARARLRALDGGRPDTSEAVSLGIATALALLTRPSGFALLPGIALSLRRTPRWAALALACALALWSPWPLRNALVLDAFVPSLTNGGLNAWNGTTGRPIGEGWQIQAAHAERGEIGLDRMFWQRVREEVVRDPPAAARRLVRRAVDYLGPPPPTADQMASLLAWPLAWLGVVVMARDQERGRTALGALAPTWILQAGLTIALVVNDRYRFPCVPLLFTAAGVGVDGLMARFGPRRGALCAAAISVAFTVASVFLRRWL